METSRHDQEIIIFAKQLAANDLEPGQYDLIMKEYIRLHKNQKEQKINSVSFLEWLALLSSIFGTIFLGIFLYTLSESPYIYLIVAILYFILIIMIFVKGKSCSN